MSFDLSWLWNWLNQVASTINSWIQSIINGVQQITQLPQAIVSGLIALGSAFWDAIQKFGSWLYNALKWFYDGLVSIGQNLYNAFSKFGEWLWSALSNIPNAFYLLGQWIGSSLINIGYTIYNIQKNIWNSIVGFIENIWNSIINVFDTFRQAINNWFVGILIRTRQKIKQQIIFSLTTYFTWKYGERVVQNANWRKLIGLPFVFLGTLFGSYLLAEMIDKLIPNITQGSFELIPPLQLPTISLLRFPDISPPSTTPPSNPPPPTVGVSAPYDITISLPSTTFDMTTASTTTSTNIPNTTYDTTTVSTDIVLTLPILSIETQVQ